MLHNGFTYYTVPQFDIKFDTFSEKSFPIWDHASVGLPSVLQTNVVHRNFRCVIKKIISADMTAFKPGTLASLLVEHVGNVTVDF